MWISFFVRRFTRLETIDSKSILTLAREAIDSADLMRRLDELLIQEKDPELRGAYSTYNETCTTDLGRYDNMGVKKCLTSKRKVREKTSRRLKPMWKDIE